MADVSGPPRRVSMAYILGFSNKPFKDGGPPAPPPPPPPRHPGAFKQMVTTPGGVIEWAASDGRRGRLTGPGKPRLTATNLAQVPESKVSVKAASKKDAAEDDIGGLLGGGDLFGDGPAAPATDKVAEDDKPADSGWTKEQDDKLLELRAENPSGPWVDTAKELDKKEHECKNRFKQIKPKDWKPNNAKGGGGSKQKQGKQKGQKNQNQGEQKEDDKKEDGKKEDDKKEDDKNDDDKKNENATKGFKADDSGNAWPGASDGGWGNTDTNGATQYNGGGWNTGDIPAWPGAEDTSDDKKEDGFNADNNGWGGGGWDNGGGNNGSNNTSNDKTSNKGSSHKDSSSQKDAKPQSNKAASQTGSKQHSTREPEKPSASAPTEYELKPDSTFSADDLRLIARILQQDCQMVWNRVSWRFKDKTGRNLHPDVFEKKITGKIDDRSSEHGRR
ncbi:hypothetical protein BU25DRAFT_431790 [Macroventuria anomochaeta]|uniref:Uncharacterized protein n=1 Tax=Macroventuria anomochaeta TaxID=301207 RepID=A0ACB6RZA0_9PLEO|nr:uncharacterized protein BU25DRAFT_431790 [Macroventuria anomochaeta]KAF2627236.1 hypothetical protein BU25DRAFT_431790 [Macroventuria anomochaeta]